MKKILGTMTLASLLASSIVSAYECDVVFSVESAVESQQSLQEYLSLRLKEKGFEVINSYSNADYHVFLGIAETQFENHPNYDIFKVSVQRKTAHTSLGNGIVFESGKTISKSPSVNQSSLLELADRIPTCPEISRMLPY